ncbi:hypothetical protein ACFLWW_02385 [Chloroflexota bacterium]
MNTDKKRDLDAVMELCKMSWDRISERRRYEWRIAFGLWGAIGAFIALLLTGQISGFSEVSMAWSVGIVGLIISVIYGVWLRELNISNGLDHEIAWDDEEKLRELSGSPFRDDLLGRLKKRRKKMKSFCSSWSSINELIVTILLVGLAVLVVIFQG